MTTLTDILKKAQRIIGHYDSQKGKGDIVEKGDIEEKGYIEENNPKIEKNKKHVKQIFKKENQELKDVEIPKYADIIDKFNNTTDTDIKQDIAEYVVHNLENFYNTESNVKPTVEAMLTEIKQDNRILADYGQARLHDVVYHTNDPKLSNYANFVDQAKREAAEQTKQTHQEPKSSSPKHDV